jgi:enoyl reductase-like protein
MTLDNFCAAADISTTEKAAEIIGGLKAVGIRHVAFKPGLIDGIRHWQVVNTVAANPEFAIIMQ